MFLKSDCWNSRHVVERSWMHFPDHEWDGMSRGNLYGVEHLQPPIMRKPAPPKVELILSTNWESP